MNVIIANKYKDSLSSLNIDVIKRMDGEFDVETITETFQNFYFNRMILDITALKDHFNISVMQQLIAGIDSSKIILFLDNDPRVNNSYLSQIISLGIYNFTRELTGITYLMENPNSYRDVAQYHDLANTNLGPSLAPKSGSDNNTSIPTNEPAPTPEPEMQMTQQMPMNAPGPQPQMMQQPINPFGAVQQMPMEQPNPQAMMMGNMNMNMGTGMDTGAMQPAMNMPTPFPGQMQVAPQMQVEQPPMQQAPVPGPEMNQNNINYNNPANMTQPEVPQQGGQFIQDVPAQNQMETQNQAPQQNAPMVNGTLVIGFKDLTEGAGATSLVYMLKKQLKDYKVLAVEVNDTDFTYFNDTELISVQTAQVSTVKNRFSQYEIVLIDINNSPVATDGTCNEVVYLMEPSSIKLNTLMRRDRRALEKLKNSKIVLNKSMLTNQDVKEFEYEAKVPIFYNLPPLDDRKESQPVLDGFLNKLGVFRKNNSQSSSGGLFGLFRK